MNFKNPPISYVAENGAADCLQPLIDAGADIHYKNEYGFGLMHDTSTPEMARTLMAAGVPTTEISRD